MKIGRRYVYPDKDLEGSRIIGASWCPGGFMITYKRRRSRKAITILLTAVEMSGKLGIGIEPFMAEGE